MSYFVHLHSNHAHLELLFICKRIPGNYDPVYRNEREKKNTCFDSEGFIPKIIATENNRYNIMPYTAIEQ